MWKWVLLDGEHCYGVFENLAVAEDCLTQSFDAWRSIESSEGRIVVRVRREGAECTMVLREILHYTKGESVFG